MLFGQHDKSVPAENQATGSLQNAKATTPEAGWLFLVCNNSHEQ